MRKKIILLLLLLNLIVVGLALASGPAMAAGVKEKLQGQMDTAGKAGWGVTTVPDPTTFAGILAIAVRAFLGLLGVIFLILMLYAGYNWMIAQGDEEKVTLAKNTITRAMIGLIITVGAYAISYFIFEKIIFQQGLLQ